GEYEKSVPIVNFYDISADVGNIRHEGGVTFNKGKKPEKMLYNLLSVFTNENDLVLDFFMGSGTTAAVAHKMLRRYIGIEQMDYIKDKTLVRLKVVICGEQTGVSNETNWHGGGSFVYGELAERSETLAGKLQLAENSEAVLDVLDQATDDGLLRPSILPDDLKKTRDDFLKFSLQEQKQLVMELLDKNKLYINLCDLDDEEMQVSEEDRAFTRSFYGMDKDTEALNE
ncbi:MAG: site-specific DNA-methyltransferase, partial [Clostridiales bacterium]|nr:site-specific DNA-methyltransferase [Clostridiales bacterium]